MKDARGIDLAIGQVIACAERKGNIAALRFGVVKELFPITNKLTIHWSDNRTPRHSTIHLTGELIERPRIAVVEGV